MNTKIKFLSMEELKSGLARIQQAPRDNGVLEMLVCRPMDDERKVLDEGYLDLTEGLIGDNWKTRGSKRTADGSAVSEMQLTIMNARVIALIAQDKERWPLAGDQIFLDMDLSIENLPIGTKLAVGEAVIEITAIPHTGCSKFSARYGGEAMKFVNSPEGKALRLRGLNAKIIRPGKVCVGDMAAKIK